MSGLHYKYKEWYRLIGKCHHLETVQSVIISTKGEKNIFYSSINNKKHSKADVSVKCFEVTESVAKILMFEDFEVNVVMQMKYLKLGRAIDTWIIPNVYDTIA